MERTFYKLLVVGLGFITVMQALNMVNEIYTIFGYIKNGVTVGDMNRFFFVTHSAFSFLLFVCALYWIPKIIKKLFPEVA